MRDAETTGKWVLERIGETSHVPAKWTKYIVSHRASRIQAAAAAAGLLWDSRNSFPYCRARTPILPAAATRTHSTQWIDNTWIFKIKCCTVACRGAISGTTSPTYYQFRLYIFIFRGQKTLCAAAAAGHFCCPALVVGGN
jgi:hypothetical protein